MAKVEHLFKKFTGTDPRNIEPPLTRQDMWRRIAQERIEGKDITTGKESDPVQWHYRFGESGVDSNGAEYTIIERMCCTGWIYATPLFDQNIEADQVEKILDQITTIENPYWIAVGIYDPQVPSEQYYLNQRNPYEEIRKLL